MRRCAAMAVAFLALYATAVPLAACLAPARALSAQERECCHHMAQMCGSVGMPQSHSCCAPRVPQNNTMAVASSHRANRVAQSAVLPAVALATQPFASFHGQALFHPPSDSLPAPPVLRI